MTILTSSSVTKKLLLRYIIDNINYKKRCQYLQEIISMGRENEIWLQALNLYFKEPMNVVSPGFFSKN